MKQLNNILETASNMKVDWSEGDYFIMPNIPLQPYPENQAIHLGFYVLFVCVSGEVEMLINDEPTKIDNFCLYALCPGNIITPKIQSEDCRLRILTFTKDFLLNNNFKSNIINDLEFFTDKHYNKITLDTEQINSLLQLYDLLDAKKESKQNSYHIEIIRSIFYTFLYEVQSIYNKDIEDKKVLSNRENELNKKFKELINKQTSVQHSIKYYSDALFISPKHLITSIKNASGKTPKVLINEAIIEDAKHYLANTNTTISEIADLLQFTDIATFSKFFKRHTTFSPSDYRKKHQL